MSKLEITVELMEELKRAIADARSSASVATAAAANANSATNTASSSGGAANARTQSNVEQASVNDSTFKSIAQDSDVNVQEGWSVFALESARRDREAHDLIVSQERKHKAELDAMNLQAIANNQNQSNLNNTLGIDRIWNVNETDAFAVLLQKVVAEAVKNEMSKQ